MKNLSFGDIWESLYQEIFDYKRLTENETLRKKVKKKRWKDVKREVKS